MKFHIKNLGPVKDADIEIRDLTIICGNNNTGKTYITYLIYSFLKTADETIQLEIPKELISTLLEKGQTVVKNDKLHELLNKAYETSIENFIEILPQIFATNTELFSNINLKADIDLSKFSFIDQQSEQTTRIGKNTKISLNALPKENAFLISSENINDIPIFILEKVLSSLIVQAALNFVINQIYVSPAERLGVSLFYKELDATKNIIVEALQEIDSKKNNLRFNPFEMMDKIAARYVMPVKDNIRFARNFEDIEKNGLGPLAKVNKGLHTFLEKTFQGRFTAKNGLKFISNKRGDNKYTSPIHLSSASLRSIVDLYFYLKYQADKNDLVIIDEPEGHLSPNNQIIMVRLIGLMVNSGLKVIITTHSDFIIREINNLILLNAKFNNKEEFLKKNYKGLTDISLNHDEVRAYLIGDNGVSQPCEIDERGIEIKLFDKVIDDLNWRTNELNYLLDTME